MVVWCVFVVRVGVGGGSRIDLVLNIRNTRFFLGLGGDFDFPL